MGGKSGGSQTVGYKYSLGIHLALCHGPVDAVQEIQVGERSAWGDAVRTPLATGHGMGRQTIDQPNLFGGEGKEGGVVGDIDILDGNATQGRNDYLQGLLGLAIPAFRGLLTLVARRVMVSANNPYIKSWSVRVRRFVKGWANDTPWGYWWSEVRTYDYDLSQEVTVGMNPAVIIAECLTNPEWGMGYPATILGTSMEGAAYTLLDERFGLNLLWLRQEPIETFIGHVLDHIGGALYVDPRTGLFELKLFRADYTSETLPLLGPDEILEVERFERAQWGDIPNEVTVVFTDWDTGKERTVTVQNLASIQSQGGVINQKREYPGVNYPPLASRLAMRDLRALGSPLARVRLKVSKSALASKPMPGDVYAFYWPRLGVQHMVLRVLDADHGTTQDTSVTIEAVEDVFGLDLAVIADEPAAWSPPPTTPVAPTLVLGVEAPYWDIARTLSRADLAVLDDTDTFIGGLAANSSPGQLNYGLYTGPSESGSEVVATGDYAPLLTLQAALTGSEADALAIPFSQGIMLDRLEVESLAYLVDASGQIQEMVQVLDYDLNAATVDLARGMLDTTPVAHAIGTRLVAADDWQSADPTYRVYGESVWVGAEPRTNTQMGALVGAENGPTLILEGRQARPYPPGRVRLNTLADPATVAGDLVIAWAHRDRIQQTATPERQDAGNIGPEVGTTYTVRIRDNAGVLVRTYSGLSGTTQTWDVATAAADAGADGDTVTVEIDSLRDGWTSWTMQSRTVERAGYGLRYGQYWGGV